MADQAQLASLLAESNDPISNLNSQLPVASPVSMENFVDQCSGLIDGVDPRSHTDPQKRSISIPKSRLSVTPFQLWEAWRMINQRERTGGLRGGLQASAAGLGKSFIVVAAVLLRASIFESARQVKAFWSDPQKAPKRGPAAASHLPASASGDQLKCPSQKPGSVVCYCVPTSKARSFIDAGVAPPGVSLIQAPLPVVGQWISIFENAVLDTSAYNLCILHSDVPSRLKRDFDQVAKSLSRPAGQGLPQAPETNIFLSAHANKKMLDTFTSEDTPSIGIMFNDESHMAMRLETRSMAIAKAQSKVGQGGLDLWLVSATPIRSLEDFELPISLISSSSDLPRAATVTDIIAARDTARSSDENMNTFQAHWRRVFDDNLVLRNTATSQFLGKPITDQQIVSPNRVWLTTPPQYLNHVQEVAYEAREVFRSQARTARINDEVYQPQYALNVDAGLHFVSLFPGAAKLIRQGDLDIGEESVRNTIEAMTQPNKLKVETIASFQQHLEEIVHASPKLDFILDEIRRMCEQDNDRRAPNPEARTSIHEENLSLKKMVIVTPTLGTAVFLYLILLKRLPALNPALFHTRARPEYREAVINSFTSLTARKNAKHSYILITPFYAGGTGLNLQSANYQILVSPLNSRDSETQCFARTNRTGQRLALHHSVLITQDNPADQINVATYAGRTIRNDPFEIYRRLVLAETDGFKAIQRLEDWGYLVTDINISTEIHSKLSLFPILGPSQFRACRITVPSINTGTVNELLFFVSDTGFGDTIACTQAWNSLADTRPNHEKLPLREILPSFWVFYLNRPILDMKKVMYYNVVQEDLSNVQRPYVYRLLGEDPRDSLVVRKDSESPQEAEAFKALVERTPFCNGARKMLEEIREYARAGAQIESFEFLPISGDELSLDGPYFAFRIHLR
ncbi:hypothetical protein LA080_000977 [Diaporthe eres]|uniref:Helicase C-terminal domain-containing protein n=1 Tax=Diaporthe vaccinii TaxID=105482 RepID=A0ABR4FD61_9PEZI|nr:hypothetical protein LA080_000977 [Diaporthe eres]